MNTVTDPTFVKFLTKIHLALSAFTILLMLLGKVNIQTSLIYQNLDIS